jgi:OOP family OmpA-OmpF porin
MLNKKLLLAVLAAGITSIGFTVNASAASDGFYLSGQAGIGYIENYSADDFETVTSVDNSNNDDLAGRISAGYQFNQNWAGEAGFTDFSSTKIQNINNIDGLNGHVSQYAIDLLAKGMLPLANGFGTYAKAGAAYVNANPSSGLTLEGSENRIAPVGAVGVSYDITNSIPVDLSVTRYQELGGSIPSATLLALGVAYHFG